MKPRIVISAVNLVEGGPLSIFQDCLDFASKQLTDRYEVFALVHRKSLFDLPQISFIEFPDAKRSWLLRMYREYWGFRRISLKLKPVLWLSLHDMTPNVVAQCQAVYCHNPAPFHKLLWRDVWLEPKFALFSLFYHWVYRINIRRNDYVIVQQDWLRSRFERLFDIRNVLVAYPEVSTPALLPPIRKQDDIYRFIYPALPRVFKNFEVLCEAAKLLLASGISNFEILLTMDGSENIYAKSIVESYAHIQQIKFIGVQSRQKVFDLYHFVDCLVFPSRLETWGLPITEFKVLNKPILAANLDYAHETVGDYSSVRFFDPEATEILADLLRTIIDNTFLPLANPVTLLKKDCLVGWSRLFYLLLNDA